jgi:hypothetical protein
MIHPICNTQLKMKVVYAYCTRNSMYRILLKYLSIVVQHRNAIAHIIAILNNQLGIVTEI